jgi:hypothetical protein
MLILNDLDLFHKDVCITLCKIEHVFSRCFFTSMVHIVVHLVHKCQLGGSVQYKWMYPGEVNFDHQYIFFLTHQ